MVEKLRHTRFNDAVMDVIAMPPGVEDSEVDQLPQLVGYRLGLHSHGIRQIRHAGVIEQHEGVEQPKARIRGQHLKKSSQFTRFRQSEEGSSLVPPCA